MEEDEEADQIGWNSSPSLLDFLAHFVFPTLHKECDAIDAANARLACSTWAAAAQDSPLELRQQTLWGADDVAALAHFLAQHTHVTSLDVSTTETDLPAPEPEPTAAATGRAASAAPVAPAPAAPASTSTSSTAFTAASHAVVVNTAGTLVQSGNAAGCAERSMADGTGVAATRVHAASAIGTAAAVETGGRAQPRSQQQHTHPPGISMQAVQHKSVQEHGRVQGSPMAAARALPPPAPALGLAEALTQLLLCVPPSIRSLSVSNGAALPLALLVAAVRLPLLSHFSLKGLPNKWMYVAGTFPWAQQLVGEMDDGHPASNRQRQQQQQLLDPEQQAATQPTATAHHHTPGTLAPTHAVRMDARMHHSTRPMASNPGATSVMSWADGEALLRAAPGHTGGPELHAACYGGAVWRRFQEYWAQYETGVHALLRTAATRLESLVLESPTRSLCPGLLTCMATYAGVMPLPSVASDGQRPSSSPQAVSCRLTDLELVGLGGKATSNPAYGEDVMGLGVGPLGGPLGAGLTRLVLARCGVAPLPAALLEGLTGLQALDLSHASLLFSDRTPQLSCLTRLTHLSLEDAVWGGYAAPGILEAGSREQSDDEFGWEGHGTLVWPHTGPPPPAAALNGAGTRHSAGNGNGAGGEVGRSSCHTHLQPYLLPPSLVEINVSGFDTPGPLALSSLSALTSLSALDLPTPRALLPPASLRAAQHAPPYTQLIHLSADPGLLLPLLGPRCAHATFTSPDDATAAAPSMTSAAHAAAPTVPPTTAASAADAVFTTPPAAAAGLISGVEGLAGGIAQMSLEVSIEQYGHGHALEERDAVNASSQGAPMPALVLPLPVAALQSLVVHDLMPQALCPLLPRLPHLTRLKLGGALDDDDNEDPTSAAGMWLGAGSGSESSSDQSEVASFCPPSGCLSQLVSLSLDVACLGYKALHLGGLTSLTSLKVDNVEFVNLRALQLPASLQQLELSVWYGLPELYALCEGEPATRVVDMPPKARRLEEEVIQHTCALLSADASPALTTLRIYWDILAWACPGSRALAAPCAQQHAHEVIRAGAHGDGGYQVVVGDSTGTGNTGSGEGHQRLAWGTAPGGSAEVAGRASACSRADGPPAGHQPGEEGGEGTGGAGRRHVLDAEPAASSTLTGARSHLPQQLPQERGCGKSSRGGAPDPDPLVGCVNGGGSEGQASRGVHLLDSHMFWAPSLTELHLGWRQQLDEAAQRTLRLCCPNWRKLVLGSGSQRCKYIRTQHGGAQQEHILLKPCSASD